MAAVDEDGQLHALWPAKVGQGVERGPDRPPRIQNIIDQDDGGSIDRFRHLGLAELGLRSGVEIVAIQADVEAAPRSPLAFDALGGRCQPLGQRDPAGVNADEKQVGGPPVPFQDLVSHPRQRAVDITWTHHLTGHGRPTKKRSTSPVGSPPLWASLIVAPPLPASLDRLKGRAVGGTVARCSASVGEPAICTASRLGVPRWLGPARSTRRIARRFWQAHR